MEKNIYCNNGIVQKVISPEAYDILRICKDNGDYAFVIDTIQKYVKKLYSNNTYLNESELYNYLINVIFEIADDKTLENILRYGIHDCFKRKMFANNLKYMPINYIDLVHMLIVQIQLMQFRTKVNNNYIDLFLIDDNSQIISSEEYERKLTKK